MARCFQSILRRGPESAAVVAHYRSLGIGETELVRILIDSREFLDGQRRRLALRDLGTQAGGAWPVRERRRPRVLLFGAFGNGNLGDAAQAGAVASLLRRMLPGGLDVAASSWECAAPFAGRRVVPLARDALLRPDWLDGGQPGSARLVVIGGGGLFGTPHFPLHEIGWVDWFVGRGVPFALLGIGGSAAALNTAPASAAYRRLIEAACFVSGRDAETLLALRAIRPDAAWFPDPVLAAGLLARLPESRRARPIDVLLIPRFPNNAQDVAANRGALAFRAAAAEAGLRVVMTALEPMLDRQVLRDEAVADVAGWDELLALCVQARCVTSARYHGVIAGLASGCVVHGLVQPKIGALLAELGLDDWFCAEGWPAAGVPLDAGSQAAFRVRADAGLAGLGTRLAGAMASTGAALAAAMA